MIKAVIFDVDGVLVDSFEANLKFYQDLFTFAGYKPLTKKAFSKMFYMTMADVIRNVIKLKDENEVKRIWTMGKSRVVAYPNHLITSPKNLKKVIEKLHKKYKLGIVTSRIRGGIFKLPQLLKFKDLFEVVVYYEDTEKHKPEPEPLLLAAEKLHLKPNEIVYIGDADVDVKAAKTAGMKIIGYSKEELPGADATTFVFDQIPALI